LVNHFALIGATTEVYHGHVFAIKIEPGVICWYSGCTLGALQHFELSHGQSSGIMIVMWRAELKVFSD
jgi:hypothetical protein